jgi:AbiJ-like protein/abortive infection Abi-like protein
MKETQFLERLYDLANLPSTDTRCKTARDDIYLHRDHFCDGDDDWFFYDNRFELMTGTDDNFLRFLCEMVHPAVRPDKGEAAKIVEIINGELSLVGWRLVGADEIAGRPIYVARSDGSPAPIALARAAADFLDADYMHREINRAERAMYDDPALAIGTAKELVETCCTLLRHMSVEVAIDADTPQLARTLLRQLSLSPETVPEDAAGAETIRALLGNFANIPHRLAELRNPYGSGHGKDGRFRGLAPRHAKLAVTAAVAFVSFVVDVYKHRSDAPVTRPP